MNMSMSPLHLSIQTATGVMHNMLSRQFIFVAIGSPLQHIASFASAMASLEKFL